MTDREQSRDRPGDEMVRLTVAEAAVRLGISEAGVRKRVQRGQIPHERGDDGRLFVWISPGETRHAESRDQPDESRDSGEASLVPELRDRIRFLERQLEARGAELQRRDVMLINMTEAMKALNPPSSQEPSEAPEMAESPKGPLGPRERPFTDAEESISRPWWRKWFGS
jgi:hypothetical protein